MALDGVVCHLLVSIQYSAHYRREHGLTSAPRAQSMTLLFAGVGGDGCNPIAVPFVVKGNGTTQQRYFSLVQSDTVITGGCRIVDMKLV